MRLIPLLLIALAPIAADAQVYYPPSISSADAAQLQQTAQDAKTQAAAALAAVPTPATSLPAMDTASGAVGTAGTYAPGNAIRPRQSRTGSCVLASGATSCSGSWDGGNFPAGSTVQNVGDPGVLNTAGAAPYVCNYVAGSITTSGFSVTCQRLQAPLLTISALTAAATAGLSLSPYASTTSSVTVTATAITKSQ